jgi:hypothetical protein
LALFQIWYDHLDCSGESDEKRSANHDISTVTGEEGILFTLAESPGFREVKKK